MNVAGRLVERAGEGVECCRRVAVIELHDPEQVVVVGDRIGVEAGRDELRELPIGDQDAEALARHDRAELRTGQGRAQENDGETGAFGCFPGGDGGDAAHLLGGTLIREDVDLIPGQGGYGCPEGPDGAPLYSLFELLSSPDFSQ